MEPWSPLTLTAVAANGDITQLFPSNCAAGSGATSSGTLRRQPTEGILYRCEVMPSDSYGGVFELWDVAGATQGGSNNVDTGTALTDSYVDAEVAAGRGKLIWKQSFKGDAGARAAVFTQRVPFLRGLAARYVDSAGGDCTVSLVVDGGYRKTEISG